MTVQDLITGAMFDLGLIQAGEVPTPDQSASTFTKGNDWLDGLATQGLTPYAIGKTTWTITSATSYTVGTGGTINIVRPVNPQAIQNIGYYDGNFSPAVKVLLGQTITNDVYESLTIESFSSQYPVAFYYSPTFPLGTLIPWPIPSASLLTGVMYTQSALAEFTSLSQTISLPPGYRRYCRGSFAREIAPLFNATLSEELKEIVRDGEASVKRANIRLRDMTSDAACLFHGDGSSNIYLGP